jgi:hypothetical protein
MSLSPKFNADEIEISSPKCFSCKHYTGDLACRAFPVGMPGNVLTWGLPHDQPIPGDKGIQYESAI